MTTKLKQRIAKLEEDRPPDAGLWTHGLIFEMVDNQSQFIEFRCFDDATRQYRPLTPSEVEATRDLPRLRTWPHDLDL